MDANKEWPVAQSGWLARLGMMRRTAFGLTISPTLNLMLALLYQPEAERNSICLTGGFDNSL